MASFPHPVRGTRGIAVAPHALASSSAVGVLREGGNAVEAMVAAAATIAVVYPHMNSVGGDGFWLISVPGQETIAIDACGAAAAAADIGSYRAAGLEAIPHRGPRAANTVAGTISGWQAALATAGDLVGTRLPLGRLLADAIEFAANGCPVTTSQHSATAAKQAELQGLPGFEQTFLSAGRAPAVGARFTQPALAATLRRLTEAGLDDFYRGDLARSMATDLAAAASPVSLADLEAHRARVTSPLVLRTPTATVANLGLPTQGLVTLLILGMLDRVLGPTVDTLGAPFVHACVEATKLAWEVRDRVITDPAHATTDPTTLLTDAALDGLAARIDPAAAATWGRPSTQADTIWMGAIDAAGVAVSFIQSTYHEFGSGIVLSGTGVTWQNRGCSFSLDPAALNPLMPGRKPFHTLNPGLASFPDGRRMVFGSMGGDGQPQSMSAVFSRIHRDGMNPQAAVSAPRWLLGRTWGASSESLKVESRFPAETVAGLAALGHDVDVLAPYDEAMGHAGALVRHADGLLEGGADPRSDGAVAVW